jgi:hypothetical protein
MIMRGPVTPIIGVKVDQNNVNDDDKDAKLDSLERRSFIE